MISLGVRFEEKSEIITLTKIAELNRKFYEESRRGWIPLTRRLRI